MSYTAYLTVQGWNVQGYPPMKISINIDTEIFVQEIQNYGTHPMLIDVCKRMFV